MIKDNEILLKFWLHSHEHRGVFTTGLVIYEQHPILNGIRVRTPHLEISSSSSPELSSEILYIRGSDKTTDLRLATYQSREDLKERILKSIAFLAGQVRGVPVVGTIFSNEDVYIV